MSYHRDDDILRDKCGVFGVIGESTAAEMTYLGLHNLQHRGQESAGIVTLEENMFHQKHGMGIVNDIFDETDVRKKLIGRKAIGHVRYSTNGESTIKNAQPFIEQSIAIAHNGEIANYETLKKTLDSEAASFQTSSDTEVFLKLINRATGSLEEKVLSAARIAKPSYSMVILSQNKLIGIRDPSGVRPLQIGKTKDGYALSSETVGFDIIGADLIREVKPGEMIVIDENLQYKKEGFLSYQISTDNPELCCVFEQIYLSRPDSLFKKNVSIGMVRREFGKTLYLESPIDADLVIDVPDSSYDAARGFADEANIRYERGFHRNHYIGRTFIEPTQALRDAAVLKKQNVDPLRLKGKRVIVVDDSIVRATNMKKLVQFIRNAGGAREVHVRVSSPPYMNSCYLGVNTAEENLLIARHKDIEEIRSFIGSDSLAYLSKEGMLSNLYLKDRGFCTYCFDGLVQITRD